MLCRFDTFLFYVIIIMYQPTIFWDEQKKRTIQELTGTENWGESGKKNKKRFS